jgi:uncharacterized protein YbjT (DUF2867 family)
MLVLSATGRIGRPIVHRLLARGHRVRAGVRDPASEAAADLVRRGALVVRADFDAPETIVAAARGAGAVVASGTAHRAGPDGERRHGLALADALSQARTDHLVYVSGAGADRSTGVPVFETKRAVEQRIATVGLTATILAPVYFMENLFNPWNLPDLKAGRFPSPIPVHAALQQVAIADLLQFAALVIEQPDEFAGQRIPIASDELSAIEAATAISRAVARNLEAKQTQADSLGPGLRALFGWLERVGHHVDVSDLHRRYPGIRWHSYDDWASSQTSRLRGLCPRGHAHATAE